MDIRFTTSSDFLQGHFYPVRKSLQGEVVLFDANRLPAPDVVVLPEAPVPTPQVSAPQPSKPQLPAPHLGEAVVISAPLELPMELPTPTEHVTPVASAPAEEASASNASNVSKIAGALFSQAHARKQLRKIKHTVAGFRLANAALSVIIFVSIAIASVLLVPSLYYALFPADVVAVVAPEDGTAFGGAFDEQKASKDAKTDETVSQKYIPPQDDTLPEGEWLIIPRIGVRSQLQPTQKPEDALNTGLWLVPDFGRAGDTDLPMIVAAHRFGWEWWWKSDYWKYHSFYNLPETQPGDRIEVISDKRKWIYEIYAGEEGEEITDYDADLILYTCKFLKSPIRHFRYARLIDPTKDTQHN